MDWFEIFIEYSRKSKLPAAELKQYLAIWNDKMPSMIRRGVSFSLRNRLNELPPEEITPDLKALIESLESKLNPVIDFFNPEIKPENLSKQQKFELDVQKNVVKSDLTLIRKNRKKSSE